MMMLLQTRSLTFISTTHIHQGCQLLPQFAMIILYSLISFPECQHISLFIVISACPAPRGVILHGLHGFDDESPFPSVTDGADFPRLSFDARPGEVSPSASVYHFSPQASEFASAMLLAYTSGVIS